MILLPTIDSTLRNYRKMYTKAFLIAGFLMVIHTSHGTELISESESSSNCSSPEESFQTGDTALSGPNLSIGDTTSIFQFFKKFTVPPPIATFVSNFHNIVRSSKTLLNLFEFTDVKPLEFAKCMYELVLESANSLGVLNPHLIADNICESVLSNLGILHSSVMINLYANAMARNLLLQGILNSNNAATLAKKCANNMEAFAKKMVEIGSNLSIGDSTSIFELLKKFTVPPPISTFVSNFHNIVQSSKTLLNLLQFTDVKPLEFAKFMYKFVLKSANSLGVLNPHLIANNMHQFIVSNLDILHSSVLLNLYANAMARSLFLEGLLNSDNATTLAKKCANDMEAFAKKLAEIGNPISKIQDCCDHENS